MPSHAEKRPEPEDMCRVELPDDPGTLLAQDGRGAVEQLQGGGKRPPRNSTHPAERVAMPMAWG